MTFTFASFALEPWRSIYKLSLSKYFMEASLEMKPNSESTGEELKQFEAMCICEGCPTYLQLGETDNYIAYCFPTRGKSKKIKEEAGCICPTCPIWEKMSFTKDYFCTRGTEKQQKEG